MGLACINLKVLLDKIRKLNRWLSGLARHPLVVLFSVVVVALGGLAAFGGNVEKLWNLVSALTAKPSIMAFGISPSAVGFEEKPEPVFGASVETVRTLGLMHPFVADPRAILFFAVHNPTNNELILTSLTYIVEDVGEVRGGAPGPLNPLAKYSHKIFHSTGEQKNSLVPPFRVPAKTTESFEVELTSGTDGMGLGWLLRVEIGSNLGSIRSEKFQLYLPKMPAAPNGQSMKLRSQLQA